jgi:hypothetical protein
LIFLLAILMVVVVIFLVFNSIKSHEVYEGALEAARSDPELTSAIGTPIDDGLFPTGSFEESGPSGSADFAIPVSGPNGSATVYAEAQKFGGQWEYTTLVAELDDSGRRINLLNENDNLDRRRDRVSRDPSYLSLA